MLACCMVEASGFNENQPFTQTEVDAYNIESLTLADLIPYNEQAYWENSLERVFSSLTQVI